MGNMQHLNAETVASFLQAIRDLAHAHPRVLATQERFWGGPDQPAGILKKTADTQHFTHVFRKHMGSTPLQARMAAAAASPVGHQPVNEAPQNGRPAGQSASCARHEESLTAGHSSDGDPLNEITLEGEEDDNDR